MESTPQAASPGRALPALLALTALGGALRFIALDRPEIWGDEAATFWRICGSFDELLELLRQAGFAPLHYLLYWWIAQRADMTPFMMRLVPAVAGTLMIPAVYAVAAQLVGRRAAMIAALLTASSAYLFNYARDAKMYMPFWLFVALNMAAWLWWLSEPTRRRWHLWVLSGVLMVGFHTVGLALLGIQALALILLRPRALLMVPLAALWLPVTLATPLLQRLRGGWRGERSRAGRLMQRAHEGASIGPFVAFVFGVAVILAAPAGYYLRFNEYDNRVAGGEDLRWNQTGIQWVQAYNAGRDAGDLLAFTASSWLYHWEWNRLPRMGAIEPRLQRLLEWTGWALLGVLLVGAAPWRAARCGHAAFWRGGCVLGVWLLLPFYAFYCASVPDAWTPLEMARSTWNSAAASPVAAGALAAAAAALLAATAPSWRAAAGRVAAATLLLALLGGIGTVVRAAHDWPLPGSVWMPRYLGFAWPAMAIVAAALLARIPTRPLRCAAIGLVVAGNLAAATARTFARTEPPTARLAADILAAQPDEATQRLYYRVPFFATGAPGTGLLHSLPLRYYLAVGSRQSVSPDEFRSQRHFMRNWKLRVYEGRRMTPWRRYVSADVERTPNLRSIVLWERVDEGDEGDGVLAALGDGWRVREEQVFPVRDHWTWRTKLVVRRRVLERAGPATAPAAAEDQAASAAAAPTDANTLTALSR